MGAPTITSRVAQQRGRKSSLFSTFRSIIMPTPQISAHKGRTSARTRAHARVPLRVTIHPIHRIPLEVLAAILIIASEDDFMFPVIASHVCRTWRSVALHTPRLWRTVDLDHREQMWAERVRRSKSCTLDIRVRSPQYQVLRRAYWPVPTTEAELIQHKMFFATAYLNRWRSLDITISRHAPHLWNAALSDCCSAWARTRPGALEELTLVYPQNDDATEFLLFG